MEFAGPICHVCKGFVSNRWFHCIHCGAKLRERRQRKPLKRKVSIYMYCPTCAEGRTWINTWNRSMGRFFPKFCHKCGTELVDHPKRMEARNE